jgi:hypothetical protein
MYRQLNHLYIVETLQRLNCRIRERFPKSNLNQVCGELLEIARESEARIQRLRRPYWPLRIGVTAIIVAFLSVTVVVGLGLHVSLRVEHVAELLQGLDAAVNEIILVALALFFLISLETRLKQRDALRALHELRSIAHVIDMHQLTKDPESHVSSAMTTPSSPQRTMTRFELSRYLDYCSELLSLTSKLAALHAQYLRDPVILNAVNDVEALAAGLSHTIWQKIIILDTDPTPDLPRVVPDEVPLPAEDRCAR